MRAEPLVDAPFGARLHLEGDDPRTEAGRAALRRLFARYGLLVLREGAVADAGQIALLSALGRIEPDETGRPLRMEVTNQHRETTAPDGELIFHFDYAYDPAPIPAISMYGATIAEGATPTRFASSSDVLTRLPRAVVERLRGLRAAHACFLERLDAPGERSREPEPLISRGASGWGPEHYWAHHPAIFANAWGVEALFVCLQHTDRFLGLGRAESDDLLAIVFEALYAPDAIYEHSWQPDDLLIWDNWTVQHARPEPRPPARTLRRYHVADMDLTTDYLRVGRERGLL